MLLHIFPEPYALPLTWVDGQTAQRWLQKRLHKCPTRDVLCTWELGSRIDAVLENRVAKHSLCDAAPRMGSVTLYDGTKIGLTQLCMVADSEHVLRTSGWIVRWLWRHVDRLEQML